MPISGMVTILHRGFSDLDRALLPEDEFEVRRLAVQASLRDGGLEGLFVFSDADDYADAAYLGGTLDGATVFVPSDGEPVLLGGSHAWRELRVLRRQTWIRDFRVQGAYPSATAALAAIVDEHRLAGRRIGVCGLGRSHGAAAHAAAAAALAPCATVDADAIVAGHRRCARERGVVAVRTALGIAQAAATSAAAAFRDGATNAEAMIVAERVARRHRARDVRLLANLAGTGLRPLQTLDLQRRERLALYVAVDYQGYWADTATTTTSSPHDAQAREVVAAQSARLRAGATAGALADVAIEALPPVAADDACSYGLGGGLGLTAADEPAIVPGSPETFASGAPVTLRAVIPGPDGPGLACAALIATPAGSSALEPIAPVAAGGRVG
jgi:Xaa-Pro aminopeptidase